MIKKLTKHGNSLALVIDRGILNLLDIDADTPLSVTTDGKCLVISPAEEARREKRFQEAMVKVNRRYAKAFKQLAD